MKVQRFITAILCTLFFIGIMFAWCITSGCVWTKVSKDGEKVVGVRMAVMYPFALDSLRISTPSGTVYELNKYSTSGGGSNLAVIVEHAVKGAVEGAK